ncbi:hypothetical protein FKM82_009526 [Ascaphus truei]
MLPPSRSDLAPNQILPSYTPSYVNNSMHFLSMSVLILNGNIGTAYTDNFIFIVSCLILNAHIFHNALYRNIYFLKVYLNDQHTINSYWNEKLHSAGFNHFINKVMY